MSVATEFAPTVSIPERARAPRLTVAPAGAPHRPAEVAAPWSPARPAAAPLAPVTWLRPPAPEPAPLRLTRRGTLVLALAVAMVGVGLVWLARLSAPAASTTAPGPRVVTVQPGDTLWSIASRVAPQVDPRAEVDRLVRLNHLGGAAIAPGEQLRVR